MKQRWIILILFVLVVAIFLAFLAQGAVKNAIILPLAHLVWLIKGYYGAFPQSVYWIIALVVGILVAAFTLRIPSSGKRHEKEQSQLVPGPVKELSFWMERMKGGIYPKWHVAHLLAELTLDILDKHGRREKHILHDPGLGWDPPREVGEYLDAALNTNYSDYPIIKRFRSRSRTPLDQDLEPVIRYLESIMEKDNDNHS